MLRQDPTDVGQLAGGTDLLGFSPGEVLERPGDSEDPEEARQDKSEDLREDNIIISFSDTQHKCNLFAQIIRFASPVTQICRAYEEKNTLFWLLLVAVLYE